MPCSNCYAIVVVVIVVVVVVVVVVIFVRNIIVFITHYNEMGLTLIGPMSKKKVPTLNLTKRRKWLNQRQLVINVATTSP